MENTFLGRGWAFPPAFNQGEAEVEISSTEENIRENIRIILSTPPGERIMHPRFGCDLKQFQFEEMDQGLMAGIGSEVSDALQLHEPRVVLNEVAVEPDEENWGLLFIHVDYSIIGTNTRSNMVYPFYLYETAGGGAAD